MNEFKNVFFKPWKGKNYEEGIDGKKMLILGESHICGGCDDKESQCGDLSIEDENCRNFTKVNCIDSYLLYNSGETAALLWHSTFTKFVNVFYNKKVNREGMAMFWDCVVFYNYVQYSTSKARVSPNGVEFANSEKAFFEVLKEFKPDLIIVWGKRLWRQMPSNGEWSERFVKDNSSEKVYIYKVGEIKIPAYPINHPSSGLGYSWHSYIEDFRKNSEKY